ncbi:hypothetical protein D4Q76_02105 [archaeon]|nr:MAG: hypothetical protein D4Q76_02105 [archaeon]
MINPPLNVLLIVGKNCNSRCIMCDIWKAKENREESLVQIKKIINEIYSLGVKNITYGRRAVFEKGYFQDNKIC